LYKFTLFFFSTGHTVNPSIPSLNVDRNLVVPDPKFALTAQPEEDTSDATPLTSPEPIVSTKERVKPKTASTGEPTVDDNTEDEDEMFTQVEQEFVNFLLEKKGFLCSLIDQCVTDYIGFDQAGNYDYLGMRGTEYMPQLRYACKRYHVRIDSCILKARLFIREHLEWRLLYQDREPQLQAVAEFITNHFMNHRYQALHPRIHE
jgi:hypothetical protein